MKTYVILGLLSQPNMLKPVGSTATQLFINWNGIKAALPSPVAPAASATVAGARWVLSNRVWTDTRRRTSRPHGLGKAQRSVPWNLRRWLRAPTSQSNGANPAGGHSAQLAGHGEYSRSKPWPGWSHTQDMLWIKVYTCLISSITQ